MYPNGTTPLGAANTTRPQAGSAQLPPMALTDRDLANQDATTPAQSPAPSAQTPEIATRPAAATPRRAASTKGKTSYARLLAAQVAIDTVMADPSLLAIMAEYGYDAARMQEGRALREQALALEAQQRAALGERFAATDARATAHARAHAAYMRHLAVARVALRGDRGAAQKLDLATSRKRAQAGWLIQAQQFYTNALADGAIAQRLAAYGLTREQLAEALRTVVAVAAALVAQQATADTARARTKERDAALAALDRWMRDFRDIARVALADQTQWQAHAQNQPAA